MKEETNKICDKVMSKKTLEICGGKIAKEFWGNEQYKYTCWKCGDYKVIFEGVRKT